MPAPYLLPLLCLLAAAGHWGAYRVWSRWFTPREVRVNDRDITANGYQDSLRKAYHAYRNRVRGAYLVALALGPNLLLLPLGWLPALLGFVGLGLLLAGYFARYFSPLLNLARGLPEYQASFDSASWPDAAAVKQARARMPALGPELAQSYANYKLCILLLRTWFWCRLGALVLAVGAVLLTVIN